MDRTLELWIESCTPIFWQPIQIYVRCYTLVLYVPEFPCGIVECTVWSTDGSAVYQFRRRYVVADSRASGALSDDRSYLRSLPHPRKSVSARAVELVDDQNFWAG